MPPPAFATPTAVPTLRRPAPALLPCHRRRPARLAPPERKRRARLRLSLDDGGGGGGGAEAGDMTCGDAFREWMVARDSGEAPRDRASCGARRLDVLFVGRDNSTVSVAAEAIFTDLCERRALDCFSSHSVGTRVAREGEFPDWRFIEALRCKRGLDISRKMACSLHRCDVESYSLVVCMDEQTRSEVLYMVADEEGRFSEEQEERIVVLSSYCSEARLRSMQFRSGPYARDAMNSLVGALVDACNGLLASLIESPPIPQS